MGGNDTILGGAGDDRIDGGAGNDVITGGSGADRLFGGPGSDTIYAADGERDVIDCGAGRDRAVVDSFDKVDELRGRRDRLGVARKPGSLDADALASSRRGARTPRAGARARSRAP